jgi:hypothetical protein
MNPRSARPSFFLRFLFPTLLALSSPLHAQDAGTKEVAGFKPFPNNKPLVISQGVIQDGRNTPATVQNLVGLIREIYRAANITVLGVDAVVVGDLTLQWQGHGDPESQEWVNPPLNGVLTTLCLASGRKFMVTSFGPNDFLLRVPENDDDGPSARRTTEVFNLAAIMKQGGYKAGLEESIRRAELEYTVLKKRDANNPRLGEILDYIEVRRSLLPKETSGSADAEKLMQQIEEVVAMTLNIKSRKARELPEFRYHPGTNLLIVIGNGEAIDVTRKVIAALEKSP